MIQINHTPQKDLYECYEIIGDNEDELIKECLIKIRAQSQNFYIKELKKDLNEHKEAIIDCHAGMGNFYIVKLSM